MSDNPAERVVTSIDNFVSAQVPQATDVIFAYESVPDDARSPHKVRVVSVYDNLGSDPIASRDDLHPEGVSKMEEYLGTALPLVLSSQHVLNFPMDNGNGKFGVALKNSEDRIDRRPVAESFEEERPDYNEEI